MDDIFVKQVVNLQAYLFAFTNAQLTKVLTE